VQDGEVLLTGKVFQVVHRVQVAPDGKTFARQIIRHPGAVVLLPLLDDGRVVLIRNYRVAAGERLIELPAGTLDPGEEPLQTARRELAEETGYQARRLELLTTFYSSPGILDERMHLFLATGLTPGPPDLQEGEDIESLALPWQEAMAMVRGGAIRDGKTLAGLLYYHAFGTGEEVYKGTVPRVPSGRNR
jgi:ADP-ribose pyrophosphatase